MDDIKAMAEALWLTDNLEWDISLYWIMLINLVLLFVLPDGAPAMHTMIAIGAIMSAVIDKTYAFGYMLDSGSYSPEECHGQIFIGTYLIRALMFAGPLMVAGSTESGKARFLGILAGISGAVYMFARWYFDQRDVSSLEITCYNTGMVLQSAGIVLILARMVLRDRLIVGRIHRRIPVTIPGQFAAHEIEIELT